MARALTMPAKRAIASSMSGSSKGHRKLTPGQKVRERNEFKAIFEKGTKARGIFLNLWYCPTPGQRGPAKLGIVVGRKAEPLATRRNVWKRRLREIFRNNNGEIKPGYSLVLMVLKCEKMPASREIEADFLGLLTKSGLINRRP
ncbi:MAG TPA: ribonuclease P protein component [Verrucomicrobiae bacterium]|nr:ribonuclease P protein component [Verrucomicrobiae bacterium]